MTVLAYFEKMSLCSLLSWSLWFCKPDIV